MRMSNLIIILSVFFFHSCYTLHRQTVKEFDYCYSNSQTEIEALININGYYEIDFIFKNEQTGVKSTRTGVFVLLDDGVYIGASSKDFLMNVVERGLWDIKGLDVGLYSVYNDTIKIEYVYISSTTSGCETIVYKIIDPNTLERVFYGNCSNPPKPFSKSFSTSLARFVPDKSRPYADELWIKDKKWFWCDEAEYKEWKEQLTTPK